MAHSLIVTHRDLDGMVSAILLLDHLGGEQCELCFANTYRLAAVLAEVAARSEVPAAVYLADLAALSEGRADLVAGLQALTDRGATLHLYDHHWGWERVAPARVLCATYWVERAKTTAAALIWRDLHRCDPATELWMQVLAKKSAPEAEPRVRALFGLLAALMQPQFEAHREQAVRLLAAGESLPPDLADLSSWYYEEHLPFERKLAEGAEVLTTQAGRRVAWVDLRGVEGFYLLSRHAREIHGAVLTVTVLRGSVTVGGEGIDRGPDLSGLHGRHEVAGRRLQIAGHRSPISIRPPRGERVDADFVAAVRRLLLARL